MEFVVYPEDDFNTWISLEAAQEYFDSRMNSGSWDKLDEIDQMAVLMTAFRSLSELTLDLSDLESGDDLRQATLLMALEQAQCEQAQHELLRDLDNQTARSVSLAGLLSVQFPERKEMDRYSKRALALLRPYLSLPSVTRFR